jgi:uncharacterized protein with GYD domain
MGLYMIQFAYTADAWASYIKNPQDRRPALDARAQQLGGKLVSYHYCFGEYDGVLTVEAPDDTTAAAIAIGAIAPGHIKASKTTKLLTVEETIAALRKAGSVT